MSAASGVPTSATQANPRDRRRSAHRPSAPRRPFTGLPRAWAAVLALLAAAGALALAGHHPVSPPAALAGVLGLAALSAAWPGAWLLALPAALPLLGWAPVTGWLLVEEFDLAVLAVAAGVLGRQALRPVAPSAEALAEAAGTPPDPSQRLLCWALGLAWTAAVASAAWRGIADAGGWPAAPAAALWWQGYRDPLNALRLAKPTLAWLLLAPCWQISRRQIGLQRAGTQLATGLSLALFVTAAVCLWERLAFTGLLDFSADYRSTGPFWEMHVGGAALDMLLAVAFPFALWRWQRSRHALAWWAMAAGLLLAAYAALTTFSRIVYLAVPLGALLMLALQARQARAAAGPEATAAPASAGVQGLVAAGVLTLAYAALAAWVFGSAGYRGMLALWGQAALLLVGAPALAAAASAPPKSSARDAAHSSRTKRAARSARSPWWPWVVGSLAALPLAGLAWWLAPALPKGPYLVHAAWVGLGALAWWAAGRGGPGWLHLAGTAATGAAAASGVQVAAHWGGPTAGAAMAPAALLLWLALPLSLTLAGRGPTAAAVRPWPHSLRWQAAVLVALAMAAACVGVFAGGQYMSGRWSASQEDQQGRLAHWRAAIAQSHPDTATLWLGHGLGRFLDHYALEAPPGHRPGDLRLLRGEDGQPLMRLVAGTHAQGFGEMLRLSQRIATPAPGPLTLELTLRNASRVQLHGELCLKHLLYDAGCWVVNQTLPASPEWRRLSLPLQGQAVLQPGGLPRPLVFSLSTETAEQPLDLRSASLRDAAGRELLHNGQWAEGGARWFFSSDRNHMPWHAKNMAVHLLFEQGLLGLGLATLAGLAALWHLALGSARGQALSPPLAAALLGAALVGGVDSLLDMPRPAALLLCLVALGLSLPGRAVAWRRSAKGNGP